MAVAKYSILLQLFLYINTKNMQGQIKSSPAYFSCLLCGVFVSNNKRKFIIPSKKGETHN